MSETVIGTSAILQNLCCFMQNNNVHMVKNVLLQPIKAKQNSECNE